MHSSHRSGRASPNDSIGATSPPGSRPFLNLLNPIGRHYHGYSPASVVEEDSENDGDDGTPTASVHRASRSTPRVQMNDLQPSSSRMGHGRTSAGGRDGRESSDDEVPQSFMIEANPPQQTVTTPTHSRPRGPLSPTAAPSSSKDRTPRNRPNRRQDSVLPLHAQSKSPQADSPTRAFSSGLNARERALWNWVNVYNLDAYLQDVYTYYEGKGIYCIALKEGLNLITVGFVIFFSTFLIGCVNYSKLRLLPDRDAPIRLQDVVVPHCYTRMSGFTFLLLVFFGAFWTYRIVHFGLRILGLLDMYRFYTHLLDIPDVDVQTISWNEIVRRIAAIRDSNPITAMSSDQQVHADSVPTAKLDAHDIANRIMRQENYLIALFNKELLDLRVPVPGFLQSYFGNYFGEDSKKGQVLTRALEWNLRFCLMSWLFDDGGRVRKIFLKEKKRKELIAQLQRRFIFMGFLNAIFAPFIVLYLIMYSFFRYFEEYHKNPSSVGGRAYTPFAQWKFREFNELPHLFTRRLNESFPIADEYMNQFPNEKVSIVMRFVAFIAGSFAAVLILATVVNPDVFLHFEITPHRTVVYYLSIFGTVLAVARGMVPDKYQVFDPERLMREVVIYTHYMPVDWKGRLHSQALHSEFGQLFAVKGVTSVTELVSVLVTPFILWYTLPNCAPEIVDFFREFTLHVDGLGHVCSFAVFNFERHGNVNFGAPTQAQDERLVSKEGKMEKSFLNFKAANPEWVPNDPSGSVYLTKMADLSASYHPHVSPIRGGAAGTTTQKRALAERARRYEQAMQNSLQAAAQRKRTSFNVPPHHSRLAQTQHGKLEPSDILEEEDRASDGGVQSKLGDSFVDDVRTRGGMLIDRGKPYVEQSQNDLEAEDEFVNGGFVGLLHQIYNQRR